LKQALQTLAIIAKIIGKIGFMVLVAAKNLLFISIEVLYSLIPSREFSNHSAESENGKGNGIQPK